MNSSPFVEKNYTMRLVTSLYRSRLNRVSLSKIVFNDKQKLQLLNAIVHPEVAIHFKNFVNNNKDKAILLYENAILFETKNDHFVTV